MHVYVNTEMKDFEYLQPFVSMGTKQQIAL